MFNKVYTYYSLFVGGWCLCNIFWLISGCDSHIATSLITIFLVAVQITAPIVHLIYRTFKE